MEYTEDIASKYPDVSIEDHVMSKDMWAGSATAMSYTEFVVKGDGSIGIDTLHYPPALYKCFDEAIVNAEDHAVRNKGGHDPVTLIDIRLDAVTGRFTITNNGPGVEVQMHPTAKMYIPQYIFGVMFKGSNLKKTSDSITGGTNGVGVKIANILSSEFTVETVDRRRKRDGKWHHQYYHQKWTDNMKKAHPPTVVDLTGKYDNKLYPESKTYQHTSVSFLPEYYTRFNYPKEKTIPEIVKDLNGVIHMRAMRAAAYIGWVTDGKCRVYYNGKRIDVVNMSELARVIFPQEHQLRCGMTDPDGKYPWEVVVVKLTSENEGAEHKYYHMSNVNGVAVSDGKHIQLLNDQLTSQLKESMVKELGKSNLRFQQSYIYKNLFLFVNAQIPGVSWNGQRKDIAEVDARKIAQYQLDKKTVADISKHVNEHVLGQIFVNTEKANVKGAKKRNIDKYTPAFMADRRYKDCHLNRLLAAEGDSAAGMCRKGVTYKPKGSDEPLLGFKRHGIITCGGVIMNARKASKATVIDGEEKFTMTEKLAANKFLNALKDAIGLNLAYKYDPESPTYKKEIRELLYGCVVACVDQDHDGVGFIFSLLINLFERFWPKLLEQGFVKRFATPVKRALPKNGGKVFEFYSELEFQEWLRTHDESKYEVRYIKGLGTHNKEEVEALFRNFEKNLYTYYPDARTKMLFEEYFGNDPDARKRILRTEVKRLSEAEIRQQRATMKINCSDHLEIEAKIHKLSNLKQKLYHAIDGLNESGRKILHGSIKEFGKVNKQIRVSQLAGAISKTEAYHHGEESLYDNITGKAFIAVGGVQLPLLIPRGQFDSRNKAVSDKKEGKVQKAKGDAAQPRYIETKLNKRLVKLLYPKADQYLLKYVNSEGKDVEPEYYVPILPTAVLESTEMPADGWKIKVWGREVNDVIRNVRWLIDNPTSNKSRIMRPCTYGHTGEIRYIRGEPYSFGKYRYDESKNTIIITELPLRVWTNPYCAYIQERKKAYVERVDNYSGDTDVNVHIKLYDGAMKEIEDLADATWCDGVEEYLELRNHMDSHLNMIGLTGAVMEFNDYDEILFYWFPVRKEYYEKRINRETLILELQLKLLKSIKRYVSEYKRLNITEVDDATAEQILSTRSPPYPRLDKSLIESPEYTPVEQLEELATEGPNASYNYLLNTTDRDKLSRAIAQREEKIAKLEHELKSLEEKSKLGAFPGAKIWHEELDELEKVINEGRATSWLFGEKDKYQYN